MSQAPERDAAKLYARLYAKPYARLYAKPYARPWAEEILLCVHVRKLRKHLTVLPFHRRSKAGIVRG